MKYLFRSAVAVAVVTLSSACQGVGVGDHVATLVDTAAPTSAAPISATPITPATTAATTTAPGSIAPTTTVTAPAATTVAPIEVAQPSGWNGPLPAGGVGAQAVRATPVRVRIEALAIDAPVVAADADSSGALSLASDTTTVAWFAGASAPGESGSAVLAAHVDFNGKRGVFFALTHLEANSVIDIEMSDATHRRFTTTGPAYRQPKLILATSDLFRRGGASELALVTCGGPFDRASHSYRDNTIVLARLS